MRLSDEKARRLGWLVWRERARIAVPAIAAVLVLGGLLVFTTEWQIGHSDRTVDVHVHEATVVAVKRTAARGAAVVRVHLDDGRDVDAVSALRLTPPAGAHVLVNEARHASGRLTWDVVRLGER
jgi:hypothetical protein